MHPEAYAFLQHHLTAPGSMRGMRVLEFGSRDVNGTPRDFFPDAWYYGIDIEEGPSVDEVADAADWRRPSWMRPFDVVICAEVFEHTPRWPQIVKSAHEALRPSGMFVLTCATDPRPPHSAVDGHNLESEEEEFYDNVDPEELLLVLQETGFEVEGIAKHPRGDLYAVGYRQ